MISEMLESFKERFVLLEEHRVPDGEGGSVSTWADGMEFDLIVSHDTTIVAQQAESTGTASTYKFYGNRNLNLKFPDVVKRISDGETFQITSEPNEKKTPRTSGLDMALVTAKKWRLP